MLMLIIDCVQQNILTLLNQTDQIMEQRVCQGGYLGQTYKYIADRGGLTQESSYPYKMTQSNVCSKKANKAGAKKHVYI